MAIRINGLASGLDTDSIVQELVKAYSTKKEKYEKSQTKLEWKMDAWKTMNSKIYGFYTSSLSNMRMSNAYGMKTSNVSNSDVAKVTASSSAVNGTQSLKVKELAASGYMTGGTVKKTNGNKVTGDTNLSELGIKAGSKLQVNNKEITISSDMTVNKLIGNLKDAGVSASFDEKNQRLFVNSSKAGLEGEFTITANNAEGLSALQNLGLFTVYDIDGKETAEMAKYRKLAVNGTGEQKQIAAAIVASVDAAKNNGNLYDASQLAAFEATVTKFDNDKATVAKYEAYNATKTYYEEQVNIYNTHKDKIDAYKATLVKGEETVTKEDGSTEEVDVTYSKGEIEEMKVFIESNKDSTDSAIQAQVTEKQKIVAAKQALEDYNAAEIFTEGQANTAAYNEAKSFVEDSTNTQAYNDAKTFIGNEDNQKAYLSAKAAINASNATAYQSDAARITAKDSEIELNGAKFTSSTGTFSINGLSITAMQVTGDQAVSITTATDTKGIYDKIKGFIGKYNELIKEMDTAYNAASAGKYEPLTDEEKESMTDKQIEKWEDKIKDSLLRRDTTLGNASSSMKSIMNTSFEIDGKKYSLATFGIATQGYFTASENERGCLHIAGDPDDSATSGQSDKLMAAINENPEVVEKFFQKLSTKLYDDLTKRMASSSLSSVYTIYNDKQMSSEYSDYKDKVKSWQEKLDYYEEFYFKKFSKMEKALSQLQSSTSSLTNLFGN